MRLFVEKIESIGAVDMGDNPAAEILFFKRIPTQGGDSADSAGNGEASMELDLSVLDEPIRERVEKALADAESGRQEELAKRDTEIASLRKQLEAEAERRLRDEATATAGLLEDLLGSPDEVAPVIADVAKAAPEAWGKLSAMLRAAAQRQDLAEFFKERGTGRAETEPVSKRDVFVKQYRERNPNATEYEARAAFWKANPEAVAEVRG